MVACDKCPVGTYQDRTGKTACKPCAGDSFQDAEGQESCKSCKHAEMLELSESSGATGSDMCPTLSAVGYWAPVASGFVGGGSVVSFEYTVGAAIQLSRPRRKNLLDP